MIRTLLILLLSGFAYSAQLKDTVIDKTLTINTLGNIIFEGDTADAFELTFGVIDPTADRTVNFQDASGTIALTSDLHDAMTLAGTPNYLAISGQVLTQGLIDLTTDVTGLLSVAQGGTGSTTASGARTNLDVDQAGTDNSTNVSLAGTPNYLTLAGQVITQGLIDISDDTNLVAGNNLSLSNDTLNVDDSFLINSGSDTMIGTLTLDGLVLGVSENISLGGHNLDHNGTNFVFDDTVSVPSDAYDSGWNGDTTAPQKDAIYDKIDVIEQRSVVMLLTDNSTAPTVVDGLGDIYFIIPEELDGMNLVTVGAHITTVSSSGLPSFQIHNLSNALDMLSTNITIDVSEKDSETATTASVINTANDHVNTGDEIRIDSDIIGTGTEGVSIRMGFKLP